MIHSITLPGGARVHSEVEGTGEPVVFLHADFVDARMWLEVRAELAPRFQVVVYDKVGFGRSEPARGPQCRRRELGQVLDALSLDAAHLVGCSNGGLQALDFALEFPSRVRSLTLINASPSGWQPQGEIPAPLLALFEAFQRGDTVAASELALQIWFDGPERAAAALSPALKERRDRAGVMNRIVVDRGTFFVADANPEAPLSPPALGRLGEVSMPTLVVDGQGDWPENRRASRCLAEGIPGTRLVEVEGAHVPPMEDPRGFAALWEGFVQDAVP